MKISFNWDIHYRCNYRCPYCWFHGQWESLEKSNKYLAAEKLMGAWKNIYEKYGTVLINIIGGEPFLYPDFKGFIRELSRLHEVEIVTNLSQDMADFGDHSQSHNVKVHCTFHPLFSDFDEFIKNVLLLREKKLCSSVMLLAWPGQIDKIEFYHEKFKKHGIDLSLQIFFGEHRGIKYPQGYSENEKNILKPFLGERGGVQFQTSHQETRGKPCYAGVKYGVIHPDGNVQRCGGIGSTVIGNIFDKNFKLLKNPDICNFDRCPCNEWAFLLADREFNPSD